MQMPSAGHHVRNLWTAHKRRVIAVSTAYLLHRTSKKNHGVRRRHPSHWAERELELARSIFDFERPERETKWEPLKPVLVVEVSYDHFTNGRFRHGTRLLRWRPDKAPKQCRMDQVEQPSGGLMQLLEG